MCLYWNQETQYKCYHPKLSYSPRLYNRIYVPVIPQVILLICFIARENQIYMQATNASYQNSFCMWLLEGLLQQAGVNVIIKGLRAGRSFLYEMPRL